MSCLLLRTWAIEFYRSPLTENLLEFRIKIQKRRRELCLDSWKHYSGDLNNDFVLVHVHSSHLSVNVCVKIGTPNFLTWFLVGLKWFSNLILWALGLFGGEIRKSCLYRNPFMNKVGVIYSVLTKQIQGFVVEWLGTLIFN